jgi:protein TonB
MFITRLLILTGAIVSIGSAGLAAQPSESQQNTQPPATQPAPTRVSSAEQEKKLTKKVNPVYPKEAFDSKLTGVINLETTIGADGKVENVRPLGTGNNEVLIKAAVDAVKQWVYKPTKINGMNVAVVTIVTIKFQVGE